MKIFDFINKYFAYIVGTFLIIISILIYFTFFNNTYKSIEKKMIKAAQNYINNNQINAKNDLYLELPELGITKGVDSCSKASGVIVSNTNGKINYLSYLNCEDYQSTILSNQNNYLELKGNNIILLNIKEPYVEDGYNIKNNVSVKEINNIQETPGVYKIKYNIYSNDNYIDYLERIVIVSKNDKTINMNDNKNKYYPQITLLGNDEMIVWYGNNYSEPGYSANSITDGDLTNKVIIKSNVDINNVGEYYIDYTVRNSHNYSISKRRIVRVIKKNVNFEPILSLDTDQPSQKVTINLFINGDGYNYTILPNQERITTPQINYEVFENNTYTFKIFDINNDEIIKEITINNIDKIVPTGTCQADFYNNQVVVNVTASDNNQIGEYYFLIDKQEFKNINSSYTYSKRYYKKTVDTIKVKINDIALNETTISCSNNIHIEPVVYKDVNGYDCIEPYVCYKQIDYNDKYQATNSGVGTIYTSGCLPTSMAIAYTKFNLRSLNGNLYTPPTLIKEIIYRDGKITGYSNYSRLENINTYLNLKTTKIEGPYTDSKKQIIKDHLANENPIVINTNAGCYSNGAHFLAIIAINSNGMVFLSDPYKRGNQSINNCPVNTWVTLDEIISKGGVNYFGLINE